MKIRQMFDNKNTVFSLEVFPPKKTSNIDTIYTTLDQISDLKPDFISVTYGAGGSGSAGSLTAKIASDIKHKYGIESMAHLTSIYTTKENAAATLTELRELGIENILALRGDRNPEREPEHDFAHASDLTKFIADFGGFDICGACYPEGHPESASLVEDTLSLRHKIDAGASHLVSQLFFDNQDFYDFRDRMHLAGIDVPVEAGIMPVVNKKQIERTVSMCGASLPKKFSKMLSRYESNPDALFDAGIAYAVDQIIDLISNGVDGIHLYAMNNPKVAHLIYERIETVLNAANQA
ncbi:MAG: methylenetetrahydrofolate reductase [NAD(P)H] [Butyricicoccaceae bacterium]